MYTAKPKKANRRLAKALAPGIKKEKRKNQNPYEQMMNMFAQGQQPQESEEPEEELTEEIRSNRQAIFEQLQKGILDDREVTIQVEEEKIKTQ
ncbi:hypothetical protein GCM10025854_12310 [Tetragenococcus muriaticus]|nr:hypothetical protein GCM10025854_12310 [Tetragenococcus muriaticus]